MIMHDYYNNIRLYMIVKVNAAARTTRMQKKTPIPMTTSTVIPSAVLRFSSLEKKLYDVDTNAFVHGKKQYARCLVIKCMSSHVFIFNVYLVLLCKSFCVLFPKHPESAKQIHVF